MGLNEFITKFADAVEGLNVEDISGKTNFNEIKQWDSLTVMTVIAMIDSDYQVILSGVELETCENIERLYDLVKKKQ